MVKTSLALERLEYLVQHAQDEKVQLGAASEILDRGWGKPAQAVAIAADVTTRDVGGIDAPPLPETLEQWLARRRSELADTNALSGVATALVT